MFGYTLVACVGLGCYLYIATWTFYITYYILITCKHLQSYTPIIQCFANPAGRARTVAPGGGGGADGQLATVGVSWRELATRRNEHVRP